MEIAYQTPKLSQFHIGFRYERRNHDNTWIKTEFTTKDNLAYFETCLNDGTFLTKSLDYDDIKEAGWELLDEDPKKIQFFKLRNFILHIESGRVLISIVGSVGLFRGRFKNYNEFIKLMDMLGIKKEAPTPEELLEDTWFERNGLV
jgi:hypothetical protein